MKDHYVDRFGTHSHIWFALLKGISVFRKTQLSMAATNSSSLNSWIDSRPLGHPKLKCVHLSLGKCKDKDSVPSTDICKRFVSWERKCRRRHHRHQTDEKCKSQDIDVLYIYLYTIYAYIEPFRSPSLLWRACFHLATKPDSTPATCHKVKPPYLHGTIEVYRGAYMQRLQVALTVESQKSVSKNSHCNCIVTISKWRSAAVCHQASQPSRVNPVGMVSWKDHNGQTCADLSTIKNGVSVRPVQERQRNPFENAGV